MRASMTVLQGGVKECRRSPVEAAYEHFRLGREGNREFREVDIQP